MDERKLYTNTFSTSAVNDRFYRWVALASFALFLGVLAFLLTQ